MFQKILCVDDDPITLMLCSKVIAKFGLSKVIDSVNNGEQALKYFDDLIVKKQNDHTTQLPKLIFLDLNMPVMNGWEFLDIFSQKKYLESFSETKVIVLSSTIDPNDIEKSKLYPMVIKFLSKPITKELLYSIDFL